MDGHKRNDVSKLQPGHVLACVNYYQIMNVGEKEVSVKDARGMKITIGKDILAEECWSADTYRSEVRLCKTGIAKLILHAGDKVFTVEFFKKNGELRKLRGHLASLNEEHTVLGMIKVVDLDLVMSGTPYDKADRLVTFQTVQSLIIDNIKYVTGGAKRQRSD
jgi:hypothetical protein